MHQKKFLAKLSPRPPPVRCSKSRSPTMSRCSRSCARTRLFLPTQSRKLFTFLLETRIRAREAHTSRGYGCHGIGRRKTFRSTSTTCATKRSDAYIPPLPPKWAANQAGFDESPETVAIAVVTFASIIPPNPYPLRGLCTNG